MIEVYNYPLSPCGEKVRFALAEKGLTWVDRHIDLESKQNLSPEFLQLSPKGLVPVLVADGTVIVESTVINEFIDDAWPTPLLRPSSPSDRAMMRGWTKLVDEVLHPAWPGIAWPILVRPAWLRLDPKDVEHMLEKLIDPVRRARQERHYRLGLNSPDAKQSLDVFKDVCDAMERQLSTARWLAGEQYSLADIALFPYLFAVDVFGLSALFANGRPRLAQWYRDISARPAFGGDARSMFDPERLRAVAAYGAEAAAHLAP
jgi:glutathione S-transferase